jgi:hypothetical protein
MLQAAETAGASTEGDEALQNGAGSIASAAANAALVDELASAAKGLLPELQSRGDASGPVAASGHTDSRSEAGIGVQEQMQAASVHSARLLKALCSMLQPEVS